MIINPYAFGGGGGGPSGTVTWNPADKDSFIVLSNGNLTATMSSFNSGKSVRATFGRSAGKYYFEVYNDATSTSPYCAIGVASAMQGLGHWLWEDDGYGVYQETGDKKHVATGGAYMSSWGTGDTIGVAVNFDDGEIAFFKNGSSPGVAFTGVSGTLFPIITLYRADAPAHQMTGRFKSADFAYSPAAGFSSWED